MVTSQPNTTTSPSPPPSSIRILTASDVDAVISTLSPSSAITSQSQVFRRFSSPQPPATDSTTIPAAPAMIQTQHRITLTSPTVTSLFMPSRVDPSVGAAGMTCKIVSVPTQGGTGGLPASTVVMDENTGKVRALVNARKLTALRNAAGSSLFLKLIPHNVPPKSLVSFGSGAQVYAHVTFFLDLHPSITNCTFIVRRSTSRADDLVKTLRKAHAKISFHIGVSDSTDPSASDPSFNLSQTVHNANIILCATSSTTALFNSVDVTSGTRVILIGSYKPNMREVDDELVRRAGLVVVDSREACAREAGELISTGVKGEGMAELGELVEDGGLADKVKDSGDIVMFKSVGLGIQDVAITALVLSEAEFRGLGSVIPDYD